MIFWSSFMTWHIYFSRILLLFSPFKRSLSCLTDSWPNDSHPTYWKWVNGSSWLRHRFVLNTHSTSLTIGSNRSISTSPVTQFLGSLQIHLHVRKTSQNWCLVVRSFSAFPSFILILFSIKKVGLLRYNFVRLSRFLVVIFWGALLNYGKRRDMFQKVIYYVECLQLVLSSWFRRKN